MVKPFHYCLFLPVSVLASLCTDPGVSVKFVCKGNTVEVFQDITSISLKTEMTLYKIFQHKTEVIALRYRQNSSYVDKILDKYHQKVSLENETILIRDFQASDEANYVMLYQNSTKRRESQLCLLAPPTPLCKPNIKKEENSLIAFLDNPGYCGKPLVSIYWTKLPNISYGSHEIITIPAGNQPGTYRACIEGAAIQCVANSLKLDSCKDFTQDNISESKDICKSLADIHQLKSTTVGIVVIVSLIFVFMFVTPFIVIMKHCGKLPKTCLGRQNHRRGNDAAAGIEEHMELRSVEIEGNH